MSNTNRRNLLSGAGIAITSVLAGCISSEETASTGDGQASTDDELDETTEGNGEESTYTDPAEIVTVAPESLIHAHDETIGISYISAGFLAENKDDLPVINELHQRFLDEITGDSLLHFEDEEIEHAWEVHTQSDSVIIYAGSFDADAIVDNHQFLREVDEEYSGFEIFDVAGASPWAVRDDYVLSGTLELTEAIDAIEASSSTQISDQFSEIVERTPTEICGWFGSEAKPFEYTDSVAQDGIGAHLQNGKIELVANSRTDSPDSFEGEIESADDIGGVVAQNGREPEEDSGSVSVDTIDDIVEHRVRIADIDTYRILPRLEHYRPP